MALKKMDIYIDLLRNEAEMLRQLGEIPNDYDDYENTDSERSERMREQMLAEEEMLPDEVILAENPEYESLTKGEKKES